MLLYAIVEEETDVQDINLYHLITFYVKKWPWILALTVLGAAAGFIYNNYIQVPLYKSDATLLIVGSEDRKTGQDSTLINNYIQLLKSRRVLEPVIAKQGHSTSYEELAASTTATNEKNTEVIKISIASKDSETSKKLVDGVVTSFKDEVKRLYNRSNISIVDNASKSSQPYNVQTWTLILITTLAGVLLSLIVLFFAYDLSLAKTKPVTKKTVKPAAATLKAKPVSKSKKNAPIKVFAKSPKVKVEASKEKPAAKKRASKSKATSRTATSEQKK